MGKLSLAREAGAEMLLTEGSFLPEPVEAEIVHELILIIGNLIDNALEAIAHSSVKQISIDFSYDHNQLTIGVSDTGLGIDEKDEEKIFIQGYSTKGIERGLGLYLIQRSVKRLGGEIIVVSSAGNGAKFQVTIPYCGKGIS
jgi:CitB family two-component system sensor histidine kinase MalK